MPPSPAFSDRMSEEVLLDWYVRNQSLPRWMKDPGLIQGLYLDFLGLWVSANQ
jgi:hypothetical protein